MKADVSFQSDYYQPFEWKVIFNQAGMMLSKDYSCVGIVNASGFLMMSSQFLSDDKIKLVFEREAQSVTIDQLKQFSEPFINDSSLFLYKIRHYTFSTSDISEEYLIFIKNIILQVFNMCKSIFDYTYDHLSHRKYDHKKISTIDAVKSEFTEITIKLDQLATIIFSVGTIETASFILMELVEILSALSRLGGARASLKNNAIEMAFNLRFFIKFIEMPA